MTLYSQKGENLNTRYRAIIVFNEQKYINLFSASELHARKAKLSKTF